MNPYDQIPNELLGWLTKQVAWFVGGSAAYLPNYNDLDVVVYANDWVVAENELHAMGATVNNDENYQALMSNSHVELGNVDIILVHQHTTFVQWHKAMTICKTLHLTERKDRVAVHHVLLERESAYTAPVDPSLEF